MTKQRHRFSVVIRELRAAELPTYQATLLAFVNCVILAYDELDDRVRIRNELLGKGTKTKLNNQIICKLRRDMMKKVYNL